MLYVRSVCGDSRCVGMRGRLTYSLAISERVVSGVGRGCGYPVATEKKPWFRNLYENLEPLLFNYFGNRNRYFYKIHSRYLLEAFIPR